MSFITKRERVFNEYDLFDLPPRNEGKLKAYASCTDARAWSHFCSDKTEHLVEIIKRNNETVRTKYVPTTVIVETLMFTKNAEIARLKQKIEEFQQLLAAYDQLDLSCDQKCEIANAHAAIKAAYKELDEMCLELDLSGFTEGLDSEAFETGKSRGDGDELITPRTCDIEEQDASRKMENKSVEMEMSCTCDVGTHVVDKRIDDMQDVIINKDAKLNAMKNTIAVMENDLCEPYCIYASIYTELEKIFAVLSNNDKYRRYLLLMISGKDIQCVDIRGKIIFKLKVLEKFCCALIAPCNRDFSPTGPVCDATCYRSEVSQINFALTSIEKTKNHSDNKRAHLVADIIQNDEMKEILSKESFPDKTDAEFFDDEYVVQDHNIETKNLARLKRLQENYDDLTTCYESLKHEKDVLEMRCQNYEDLEKEFEHLKLQIKEYNSLWNEKEHYRKRSMDLDALKEHYLLLTDETENLETQLKAETEINHTKCKAMDELWNENLLLEKKLSDSRQEFEKEKNILICKLREAECRIMCQGQQIKSLSLQIDRLLEQDPQTISTRETEENSIALIDEVESHKDRIKSLKDVLFYNEEEKQNLQQQFKEQLKFINDLKMEVEYWKSAYEKTKQRNEYLEKITESLIEETKSLSQDVEEKSQAVENLISVIDRKSQEIDKLISEAEKRKTENKILLQQITNLQNNFNNSLTALENEKLEALKSLQIARAKSQELLEKFKDYDQILHSKADVKKSLEIQIETKKELENQLSNATNENMNLKMDLVSRENSNSVLLQDIQELHNVNKFAIDNISKLQEENKLYKTSLETGQKENSELRMKLINFENITDQLLNLQDAFEKLSKEKEALENELLEKSYKLDNSTRQMQLNARKSEELLDKLQQSESAKEELLRLDETYRKVVDEKHALKKELLEKKNELQSLSQSLNNMKLTNERLSEKCREVDILNKEVHDLKNVYDVLLVDKKTLLNDYKTKTEELNDIYETLQEKIEENQNLNYRIMSLEQSQLEAQNSIQNFQEENDAVQARLHALKQENADLISKLKSLETLDRRFNELQISYNLMQKEKEEQLTDLETLKKENTDLHRHSQTLMSHSNDLEAALITSRTELINNTAPHDYQDILKEIEEIRQEKLLNQKVIRDLKNKVEESDYKISTLTEDVDNRDRTIAIMQNHINELKKEMENLQNCLDSIVDIGEDMRDFNFQNMQSTKMLEAHHSKATHNMKMELAQLQHQNSNLKEQLSFTKIKSVESSQHMESIEKKIDHLERDREIIVTDIKQLEMQYVGDSTLAPTKCATDDILISLDRIRKWFDEKNSKSASLEQTILKVKTSSQLFLCKAKEAKTLVEEEKQKIINEKENAIKDRQSMEKQLLDFKNKLEKQIANDKTVINDLEATILNQKLLINKINESTAEYISKLEDELQKLKSLYDESICKIDELQKNLQNLTEDRNLQIQLLEKFKSDFDAKSKEVCELQKELEQVKHKTVLHIETQTYNAYHFNNSETQTDDNKQHNAINRFDKYKNDIEDIKRADDTIIHQESEVDSQFRKQPLSREHPSRFNELQILTVNVEPPFDYVKNNYVSRKLQCLSTRMLENYSISTTSSNERSKELREDSGDEKNNTNLIDIYNRQSMQTNSSKVKAGIENLTTRKNLRTSTFIEFPNSDSNDNDINSNSSKTAASHSGKVLEKDMFVIYKDSLSNYDNKGQENVGWSEIVVENLSVSQNEQEKDNLKDLSGVLLCTEEEEGEKEEDDSVKPKLNIEIPRVVNESNSQINTISSTQKSLDCDSEPLYSSSTKIISTSDTKIMNDKNISKIISSTMLSNGESPCFDEVLKEHLIRKKITVENKNYTSTKNHKILAKKPKSNKLSRADANVLLHKNDKYTKHPTNSTRQEIKNFGLDYIIDTVQAEVNPKECKNPSQELRSIRSEEIFNAKAVDSPDDNLSRFCNDISTPVQKTISTMSKFSTKSYKRFTEKAIMVNMDISSDYDKTINSLTKALENIEKDYKKKIEAIKAQYDNNIKSIINEHNQGVKNIQYLHEDTLQDIIKSYDNEVENLRSMSIEASRKADLLEKENDALKVKFHDCGNMYLDKEPTKMIATEMKKRKKYRGEAKLLTKTTVEAFNVKPEQRAQGPCTCTLDINLSDTIRNIFEQVDVEQRAITERKYLNYVANKMLNGNIENLDAQELSFLHLKVCRMWKNKLNKEEALQKRIDSLETELINKQRNTQQHIAELDRKVAEERRRLQIVRDAVCRTSDNSSPSGCSPASETMQCHQSILPQPLGSTCTCITNSADISVNIRGSAGDLAVANFDITPHRNVTRHDNNRAVLAKLDSDGRRAKRLYNDEPPTRLRRSHDRPIRVKK